MFWPRSSKTWGLIIGVMIILAGLIELFGNTYTWLNWDSIWPYFIIILGLAIIGNVLFKQR
jgi:hypothetical protein